MTETYLFVDVEPVAEAAVALTETFIEDVRAIPEPNPNSAIDRVRNRSIDGVVTAATVDDESGFSLVDRIERIDPDVPCVVFANELSPTVRREATAHAVTACVRKQLNRETIRIVYDALSAEETDGPDVGADGIGGHVFVP
jgi:DNA-binding NarL/FixJ family response regulator